MHLSGCSLNMRTDRLPTARSCPNTGCRQGASPSCNRLCEYQLARLMLLQAPVQALDPDGLRRAVCDATADVEAPDVPRPVRHAHDGAALEGPRGVEHLVWNSVLRVLPHQEHLLQPQWPATHASTSLLTEYTAIPLKPQAGVLERRRVGRLGRMKLSPDCSQGLPHVLRGGVGLKAHRVQSAAVAVHTGQQQTGERASSMSWPFSRFGGCGCAGGLYTRPCRVRLEGPEPSSSSALGSSDGLRSAISPLVAG